MYPLETLRLPYAPRMTAKMFQLPPLLTIVRFLIMDWMKSPAWKLCRHIMPVYPLSTPRLVACLMPLTDSNWLTIPLWSFGVIMAITLGNITVSGKSGPFSSRGQSTLIIRNPKAGGKGQPCRRIVEFVDIYPTLTELAGLPTPKQVEGRSLKRLLDNPLTKWNGTAITQVLRPVDDRLKNPIMGRSIRTERWRYSEWGEGKFGEELYDHFADPMEFNNLALNPTKENYEIIKKLKKEFTEKASGRVPTTPFNPKRL